MYTGYVNQYNTLTATLSEMKRTQPKFNAFLESVRWQVPYTHTRKLATQPHGSHSHHSHAPLGSGPAPSLMSVSCSPTSAVAT